MLRWLNYFSKKKLLNFGSFQPTGTLSRPPYFPALIIFKPLKPECTNTYAFTLSLDQLSFSSVIQGLSRPIPRGCILLVRTFLYSIAVKKKYISLLIHSHIVTILQKVQNLSNSLFQKYKHFSTIINFL